MLRTVRAVLVVVFAAAAAVAVAGSAASAGSFCSGSDGVTAPDGRIKVVGESFVGSNSWPQSSVGVDRGVGGVAIFRYKWKNVTFDTHTIRVNLHDSDKDTGFGVRWFLNGVNVSSVLKGGDALVFHNIASGRATPAIELVVKNKNAAFGDTFQYLRGRYQGSEPNRCDMLVADVDAVGL
jgi:hypothetical protein